MTMKGKNRRGFTLVELVVVIAIIGILAAILVPSIMGYVRKANKKADVATASMIGKQMVAYLTLDPSHWSTLHINETRTIHTVVAMDSTGIRETYQYRNLFKINGNNKANNTGGIVGHEWSAGSGVPADLVAFAADFTQETKQNIVGGSATGTAGRNGGFLLPMKTYSHDDKLFPEKKYTDRWLIGVRVQAGTNKDTETIEVWAGWSNAPEGYPYGRWGNSPTYRLWPSPDREYLTS